MRDILAQIDEANRAGLYYVALFSALSIPDICGALEAPDGEASGVRYIDWYDRHVDSRPATGEDIYRFRCSLLHQGRTAHPKSAFARVIFIEPGATPVIYHNNQLKDALLIDVRIFISDILAAATRWLSSAEKTADFQRNFSIFVARYPDGLKPYVIGLPVIG